MRHTGLRARLRITSALSLGQKITLIAAIPLLALLSTASGLTEAAPDTSAGKQLFDKRCSGCHSLDHDKEGPRLGNVYGRHAGTVPSFKYSAALQGAQVTWDSTTLDRWLADPDAFIAENDMAFHVPNPVERSEIIRFLKQSAGQ